MFLRNIWGSECLKHHLPKSWELWWHMTWFLRVHGKKLCTGVLLRSSRRLMLLTHQECQQSHTENQLWPSSTSRCLHSAKAPETSWISYSSTIQRYTGSPISSERMPGLVSTATQFPFKERPQDTQRKRSHFNCIELLRFPSFWGEASA